MRRKISESNTFPNFDLFEEYRKIEYLLSEAQVIGTHNRFGTRMNPSFTMEQYINEICFLDWELRGTFISIDEMRQGLGIEKERFAGNAIDKDLVLDFIQYAANCNLRVAQTIEKYSSVYLADKSVINVLIKNSTSLLSRLGAHFILDDETNEAFVVLDDDLSIVVADEYPEVQVSLSEYRRIDNRGDLKRKGEVLCTLFKRLEAEEKKFSGTTYANLCKDTTFLFDKAGIRHWVDKDKIASKTFMKMSPDELELWYDNTYTMFLSCMIISKYLDLKNDIKAIKSVLESETSG